MSSSDLINWTKLDTSIETGHFQAKSKRVLYLKRIHAKNRNGSKKTLVLFHDLGSYHEEFEKLVQYTQEKDADIGFILLDFFGHGLSSGTRVHIDDFDDLAKEISCALNTIPKEESESWIGVGQGVGALVLLSTLKHLEQVGKTSFDKVIMSHFLFNLDSMFLSFYVKLKALLNSNFLDVIATLRPFDFYQANNLTSDAQRQIKYLHDPLNLSRPTLQTMVLIERELVHINQMIRKVRVPILLLQGGSPYCDKEQFKRFKGNIKKDFLTQKLYPKLAHDLYNETDSYLVFNDILEWI